MKPLRLLLFIGLETVLLLVSGLHARSSDEYALKAAFVFNFTRFIEWPQTAPDSTATPFVIAVLGDDPFEQFLEQTVTGESVNDHPIEIHHYRHADELGKCHILFISSSEESRLDSILRVVGDRSILTVSALSNSAANGVMIGLVKNKHKIKLQINLDAVNRARLEISSKLLKLAEII